MTVMIQGNQVRALALGIKVDKSVAPANATTPLFTVSGGKVLIVGIIGEVTTVMSATATSLSISHDPTNGSAGPLCAATVVTSDELGTLYGFTGVPAELLVSTGTAVPSPVETILPTTPLVLAPGVIGQVGTAVNTGVTKWTCIYVPIDDGAAVVAA